jgi:hypothetical protein
MVKILAIVDEGGRVMAAQFGVAQESADEETPSEELLPLPGQRRVEMDVPDEIEHLSGADLTRFFSHVEVVWPSEVTLPQIEVRRSHESSSE